MQSRASRFPPSQSILRGGLAVFCSVLLLQYQFVAVAQQAAPPAGGAAAPTAQKLPPEQLDSLVAPIALYPDPLLAQTLVASTYPLEIIQLQQWMAKNKGLKDKALADAVAKQPWDPSIQSMAAFPDVVKRLADDVQWTTDLGNAFLAQQSDVMDAVQRMRKKAADNGALKSDDKQKVQTEVIEQKTVIVVEPANPEVIYVPSYSPTVVYGAPVYPYPPIYYPPYPPGAGLVTFGFGMMMGAAIWGGSCCNAGWGGNNVNINVNNNFNKINHNTGGGRNNSWQHNPQHRGAAPYSDKATANKFGGQARGEAPRSSQQAAGGGRTGGAGGKPSAGTMDRGGAGGAGGARAGGAGAAPSAGATNRGAAGGGGGDRIGSQNVPKASPSKAGGMGGGSSGYSGSSARSSSSRGASSMSSHGGGGSRGGGGGRRR